MAGQDPQAGGWSPALILVLVAVLLAGALFGYDQGVISGALLGLQRDFKLSPLLVEVVTSWVTLGALGGSLAGGELADRLGRRKALVVAAALFAVRGGRRGRRPRRCRADRGSPHRRLRRRCRRRRSAAVRRRARARAAARPLRVRLPARDHDRHLRRVSRRPGAVGRSQLAAHARRLGGPRGPAPRSPCCPRSNRRAGSCAWAGAIVARAAIMRARPWVDPDVRLQSIEASLRDEPPNASWGEVFAPAWRRPLMIGLGLAVFQQITGINAIIYYSDRIFAAAGFSSRAGADRGDDVGHRRGERRSPRSSRSPSSTDWAAGRCCSRASWAWA